MMLLNEKVCCGLGLRMPHCFLSQTQMALPIGDASDSLLGLGGKSICTVGVTALTNVPVLEQHLE